MSPSRRTFAFARFASRLFRPKVAPPIRKSAPRLSVMQLEDRAVPAFLGGVNVAVGDVNGDGFPDIVAAMASQGSQVKVIDGRTGTASMTINPYGSFAGGTYIAVGDIDGDGTDEIITGTGNGGGPNVKVFDGSTGAELLSFFPYEGSFRGGVIVAAGDTDGDGIDEIITGTGVGGGPRVQVIDALTQQPISNFFAYEDSFRGGVLVGAGDTDGDGRAEIITGTGVGGGPRVQVIDALSLEPLANFFAYEDSFRGGVLINTADLDGDRKAEVLTGTGPGGGPVVTAFDSASLQSQARFLAADGTFRGGVQVAGNDTNGDTFAEFVTGTGPGGPATVRVFTPDGSKVLYSFAPFDGQLPNVPVSVQIGNGTAPALADFGLSVSQDRILVGSSQQIVFTSRAPSAAAPSRVQLYASDANGAQGEFLLDLFDDGDFTHRDITAGDGIFNNAITVSFPTAGDKFYRANVTIGGVVTAYTVSVKAVARPSDAAIQQRLTEAEQVQTQLDALLAGGASEEAALIQIEASLNSNSALAQPGSVERSANAVYWTTPEGIPFAVSTPAEEFELSGGGAGEESGSAGSGDGTRSGSDPGCDIDSIFLSPFAFESGVGANDPANILLPSLTGRDGFTTPIRFQNASSSNRTITVDYFRDLSRYDLTVITTHGLASSPNGKTGPVLDSGERVDLASIIANIDAVMANQLCVLVEKTSTGTSSTFGMQPRFFLANSGLMKGHAVVLEACFSMSSPRLSQVFRALGADVVAGFDSEVDVRWATQRTVGMVQRLANGGEYATIPNIGAVSPDANQARFVVDFADPAGTFEAECDILRNTELVVAYSWPNSQKDLDTGTLFLGSAVGFRHGGSVYMNWSGDNTSTGGVERVVVDIHQSFLDSGWNGTVTITLRAGWYSPAGGSGSATVYVGLRNTETGEVRQAFSKTIAPGSQSGAATTVVGSAIIALSDGDVGDPGSEHVELTLT